jgi:hypothetical protein
MALVVAVAFSRTTDLPSTRMWHFQTPESIALLFAYHLDNWSVISPNLL